MKKVLEQSKAFYQVNGMFRTGFIEAHYNLPIWENGTFQAEDRETETLHFVQLSDLHDRRYGRDSSVLLRAVKEERPDLIFLTGDMATASGRGGHEDLFRLLKSLGKVAPVFYSLGNHEMQLLNRRRRGAKAFHDGLFALKKCGVHILHNRSVTLTVRGVKVSIHGLTLPAATYRRVRPVSVTKEYLNALFGETDEKSFHVLLAHSPVHEKAYADWGADLVLSGHLHGGIVRLFGSIGLITPQFRIFYRKARGCFPSGDGWLVVSAGLGEHHIPVRIANPHEMIVVHVPFAL